MIFETMHESAQRRELMLVDGGMCHWHLRRDGQLTIREIISTRKGAGSLMLRRLEWTPSATSLFAKCPADLPANDWYSRRGFRLEGTERTKSGRLLICWRKPIVRRWQPNAGMLEVIYCAGKNRRMDEIALDAGLLLGVQLPETVYHRPYFVDQDWRNPDRARYMAALAQYRPWMATVLDWERPEQLPEVLSWAEEAAQYVAVVIIIPKVVGGVKHLPKHIGGRPVRLGYSVPTKYAGTPVPLAEFQGWPHGVHLLGGSPDRQMSIYRKLGNVRSVDANYSQQLAMRGQFWMPSGTRAKNETWPTLEESGGWLADDAPYEANRRSCSVVMAQWRRVVLGRHNGHAKLDHQLPLWEPAMAGANA